MVEENDRIAEEPWISYHRIDGERVTEPAGFDFGPQREEGAAVAPPRMYRHFRPKFLKMLISQLQRLGIQIEYGFRAVDYYETEDGQHAGAIFADGSKLEADVVVAADGIGTKSYKAITGQEVRAWSSGWATARALVPVDRIAGDTEVNERFNVLDNGHPVMQMWRSYVLSQPTDLSSDLHASYDLQGGNRKTRSTNIVPTLARTVRWSFTGPKRS